MGHDHLHKTHPAVIARLKRASGHLKTAIAMMQAGRPCLELAQQLQAVEKAIVQAKKTLIHDHIDHCLDQRLEDAHHGDGHMAEFKEITKYL